MKSISISHFNGKREQDELVIYDQGSKTGTNKYGWEACVSKGRVISCGGNDNDIPSDGFVASGHGEAAIFLADQICVGARVNINNGSLEIEIDEETNITLAKKQISDIQERIDILEKLNEEYDSEKARMLLASANEALKRLDFESVAQITEEAYYITSRSVKDEIRGAWHRPNEKNEEQVEATVKRFADAGFNLMLIETNYEGYANALKCVADYLPKRGGDDNNFDVIDAFIRMGKKYGVKIHAWFENFFFGHSGEECVISKLKPHWMARRKDGGMLLDGYDSFYFLNPALPEVREFLLGLCKELLDKYDFDGFQLDYIRYPHIRGIEYAAGFDDTSKKMFFEETGIDLDTIQDIQSADWEKYVLWCADKVTLYVESVYKLIQEYRRNGRYISLSTAVVGDPQAALMAKCQDWRRWVTNGWLDEIYPMAYYNDAIEVEKEIAAMVNDYGKSPNISGISPMYNGLPLIETTKQVEACRRGGAKGIAFFSAGRCSDEELEKLKIGVYRNK